MFVTYALTLVCSVFPCTHVVYTNAPVQVSIEGPHTENQWIQVYSSNHNDSSSSVLSSSVNFDPNSMFLADQPNDGSFTGSDLNHEGGVETQIPDNFLDTTDPIRPVVQVKDGKLRGSIMNSIAGKEFAAFQGIPFAQPPIGNLRFKAPVRNSPWNGTQDAIAASPICIQTDYIKQYQIEGQEDCLYLNVYTPQISSNRQNRKVQELLPVLVFIHGGGWFFSSSSLYGPQYILDQDVVLVSMNYRLGVFGFLSTGDQVSPGNNGLKDQTLALQWIQENIAKFGGDSSRVTIFGESAGAGSVHLHMVSPLSRGLFHGGISQSGCATCFWSISEQAANTARTYASFFNCTGSSGEIVNCLQEKDAKQLVGTQLALLQWTMYPVVIFGPVIEPSHPGAFLDQKPENVYENNGAANVPWISGFNADEGAINIAVLFLNNISLPQLNNEWDKYGRIFLEITEAESNSLELSKTIRDYYLGNDTIKYDNREKAVKMFSDRYVIACGVKGIRMHAKYSEQPVYAYNLAFRGKNSVVQLLGQNAKDWGVSHLDDLIYLFNNTAYYPSLKVEDPEYQMAKVMTGIWANFAKTGKPLITTLDNQVEDKWRPVSKSSNLNDPVEYLELTESPRMIEDPYHARVQFWNKLGLVD